MSDNFVYKGFPSEVIMYNSEHVPIISVEDGTAFKSSPYIWSGDVTNQIILSPQSGKRLKLKGMSVVGEGNVGSIKVHRQDGTVILPVYFSVQQRGGVSGAFNFLLNIDESVYVTTDSRGNAESFVGISYLEVNGDYI